MPSANGKSMMNSGDYLNPGESLVSPNGLWQVLMQSAGNLVIGSRNGPGLLWSSNVDGGKNDYVAGSYFILQTDGNLVVYKPDGTVHWASNYAPQNAPYHKGNTANINQGGNFCLVQKDNVTLDWTTDKYVAADPSPADMTAALLQDLHHVDAIPGGTGAQWQIGNFTKLTAAQQAAYAVAAYGFFDYAVSEYGIGASVHAVNGWSKSRIGANVLGGGNIGYKAPTTDLSAEPFSVGWIPFFDQDLQGIATDQDVIAGFKTQLENWANGPQGNPSAAVIWPIGQAAKWLAQYNSSQSIGSQIGKTVGPLEVAAGAVIDVVSFGSVGTGLIATGLGTTASNNFGGPKAVNAISGLNVIQPPVQSPPPAGPPPGTSAPNPTPPPAPSSILSATGVSPQLIAGGAVVAGLLLLLVLL